MDLRKMGDPGVIPPKSFGLANKSERAELKPQHKGEQISTQGGEGKQDR